MERLQESVIYHDRPLLGVALLVGDRLVGHHLDLLEERLKGVETLDEGEHLEGHLVQLLEEDGLLDKVCRSSICEEGFGDTSIVGQIEKLGGLFE